ncbi:YtoQ family protein [Lacimicrobium sp. SS2-24]|uniref:YtoQ family protein n=1 Tax=Lacimicrobium sp. SS2-24 TaxID=2005569 RepID=UPI000B4A6624|nr:YtoQ family protein [Lacimicrobium sp. SS2-24]
MNKRVYLAGKNHSYWLQELQAQAKKAELTLCFRCPGMMPEYDLNDVDAVEKIREARCIGALNDAFMSDADLIVVCADGPADQEARVAAGQAIISGKPVVLLQGRGSVAEPEGLAKAVTAVAADVHQLLAILRSWNNLKATDKN